MDYIAIALCLFAAYILFCKAWPYFLYPNYFRKSKIESYPELKELASSLKSGDKLQTLKNVYVYMCSTYTGYSEIWKIPNLLTVFELGDFPTKEILNKKQFLWCHTQNRLFKSILVNTGEFSEGEIKIKKLLLRSFFIHQWLSFDINGETITVDPHCGVLEIGH
jgi:hypothetical protein